MLGEKGKMKLENIFIRGNHEIIRAVLEYVRDFIGNGINEVELNKELCSEEKSE